MQGEMGVEGDMTSKQYIRLKELIGGIEEQQAKTKLCFPRLASSTLS